MDVFSKSKRSDLMSRIRSRGNKATEIALAKLLRSNSITGWRRHLPLVGRPDFTFSKAKLIVFVDGCFWHGCPRCYRAPKSRRGYWSRKVLANRTRDRRVNRELTKKGWLVLRIWECHLTEYPEKCVGRLRTHLP